MDMRIPTLRIKIMFESNPLKSIMLVGRLAVPSSNTGVYEKHPFHASLGRAIQRQKLRSSPWFGALKGELMFPPKTPVWTACDAHWHRCDMDVDVGARADIGSISCMVATCQECVAPRTKMRLTVFAGTLREQQMAHGREKRPGWVAGPALVARPGWLRRMFGTSWCSKKLDHLKNHWEPQNLSPPPDVGISPGETGDGDHRCTRTGARPTSLLRLPLLRFVSTRTFRETPYGHEGSTP